MKPDLGKIVAQTIDSPDGGRKIEVVTLEICTLQQQAKQMVLGYAIEIGRRLVEAKSMLPHGAWGNWLKNEVNYSHSTANNLMRIFEEYGASQQSLFGSEANSQALGNLTYTKALQLIAIPEEEREAFVQENDVEHMSSRELQNIIRERDEARKAAEGAKADAAAAEQARAKMAEDMALLNACLAGAREDKELAEQATARLEQELAELKAKPVEVAVETVTDPEAIEKARAEAVAEMQDKLDKAKEAKDKAAEKAKAAEEARDQYLSKVEDLKKRLKRAEMGGDKEVAQFEVLFNQVQASINQMNGILIKARGREDQTVAQIMKQKLQSLADDLWMAGMTQ